ncbi:MAG: lysylphosphatidylglycerol synthase transmembrane domain-containing protein [Candidatus Saccharimonadales bacterium]
MNQNQPYWKRHWKSLLNIVVLAALLAVIIALRSQLLATIHNLAHVHAWVLLAIIPLEVWNYDAQTRLYRGLFEVVGNKLSYKFLFKAALELNFINSVFPSGGVSGISYFGARMRNDQISGGKATAVQLFKLLLLYLSFEVLLIIGLFFLALSGHVNGFVILVATAISTLLVVGTFAFILIIGSRRRINATFSFITRALNGVIKLFRPSHKAAINIESVRHVVDELHDNYKLIHSNYRKLKNPFVQALAANLSEVLAAYIVYVAFGHFINFGAIILAYAVANFAGLVSVLPGGIGIFEALMTAVLAVAGVPLSLSIPATIMYRIINMIFQLPPGYYFYHRGLQQDRLGSGAS